MYIIIGGDQKEYGPVSAEEVSQWIGEGPLNEQSQVKAEGDAEFRPLTSFPEFAGAFTAKPPPPAPPALAGSTGWEGRDYELDIGGCISRGWELVKNNMGVLFVGTLIYFLIEGAIGAVAQIPIVGALASIANFVISGPLMGGVFYLFIRAIRNEQAEIGDIFSGFRRAFAQLFLGTLVKGLLIGLFLIPIAIVVIIRILPLIKNGTLDHLSNDPVSNFHAIQNELSTTSGPPFLPILIVCLIPIIYLQTSWAFTLPLIVDKQIDFWTAMKASFKMVNKHWFIIFGLIILIDLLNVAGVCACCVGVLFTIPIGIAALMFAYETIFSERQAA